MARCCMSAVIPNKAFGDYRMPWHASVPLRAVVAAMFNASLSQHRSRKPFRTVTQQDEANLVDTAIARPTGHQPNAG